MTLYDILNLAGAFTLLFYNLLNIKERRKLDAGRLRTWAETQRSQGKKGILLKDGLWLAIEIIVISVFQYTPAPIFNSIFGNLVGTGSNYFGLLYTIFFILLVACWILKIDAKKQMDIITPAFPLALFFAKLGCFSAGCCNGIPWNGGIANAYTGVVEFPIQLLEALIALILFLFFHRCRKRFKEGAVLPVYIMTYSCIRFFTEFLRSEGTVLFGLKFYQYLCLIGILLGAFEYYYFVVRQKKEIKAE